MELIVSVLLKRPAHKEQHLCAEKAYDSVDLREFVGSLRATSSTSRLIPGKKAPSVHRVKKPQRGFTRRGDGWWSGRISWLVKRRSLRTRWSKKAENWLALIQLACSHILLNLAVFG